jgi:hypothetical protein
VLFDLGDRAADKPLLKQLRDAGVGSDELRQPPDTAALVETARRLSGAPGPVRVVTAT